jgi:maleate isomerase
MTRHIGFLIPSSNTNVELELNRALPASFQLHAGRLLMETVDRAGWRSQDADIDYQARLLGTARVELVILAQTAASFFADGYDAAVTARIAAEAGVPALTAGQIVGRAVQALGARRIALLGPWPAEILELGRRYFEAAHGLAVAVAESFGAVPNQAIRDLGLEAATAAMTRADRPEVDVIVVAGGNFPTLAAIAEWERRFAKPIVTTNQAAIWAILRGFEPAARLDGIGKLLATLPAC